MPALPAFQVDVFMKIPFEGNPACVVLQADGLTDEQIQRIVRELHNAETAFVFNSTDSNHDVLVRFFTQTCETPLCGHATIAAIYVLAEERRLPESTVRMKCQVGICPSS